MSSAWLREQHQGMLCPAGKVHGEPRFLMVLLMFPQKSPLQSRAGFAEPFHRWLRELDRAAAATSRERFVGEKPAGTGFIYKYQLLMAQPALQVMLTSCYPRNPTFPSVFCSH